jgi:hypothetical protein
MKLTICKQGITANCYNNCGIKTTLKTAILGGFLWGKILVDP